MNKNPCYKHNWSKPEILKVKNDITEEVPVIIYICKLCKLLNVMPADLHLTEAQRIIFKQQFEKLLETLREKNE